MKSVLDFKDEMAARAFSKRTQHEQITDPNLLSEINDRLKEVLALLKSKSGSVQFTVTERDDSGKIKSFKVDQS